MTLYFNDAGPSSLGPFWNVMMKQNYLAPENLYLKIVYSSSKLIKIARENFWLNAFVVLLAVVSIVHLDVFYNAYDQPKWFLLDVGLSIFVFKNIQKSFKLSKLIICSVLLLFYMVLSMIWAHHIYASIEFTLRFLLFLVTVSILMERYSKNQLMSLVINASCFSSIVFSLVFFLDRLAGDAQLVSAYSPIGFVNNAGHVINIWIPCLLIKLWQKKSSPVTALSLIASLLTLMYLVLEGNIRATFYGLILGGLGLFICLIFLKKRYAYATLAVPILMLVSLCLFSLPAALKTDTESGELNLDFTPIKHIVSVHNSGRLNMLSNNFDMLKDNPWGVGINNFEYLHPKYAKVGTASASPSVNIRQVLKTPHNFFVKMYTELGALFGSIMLGLFVYCSIRCFKNILLGNARDWYLFIAFLALLFHAQLSAAFITPVSYAFSILLFAVLLKKEISPSFITPLKNNVHLPSKPITFIVALIPLLSLLHSSSEYFSFKGQMKNQRSDFKTAVLLNPGNDRAWLKLSHFQSPIEQVEALDGLVALERFLSLYPQHIYARIRYVELLSQNMRFQEAKSELAALKKDYPHYSEVTRFYENIVNYWKFSGVAES